VRFEAWVEWVGPENLKGLNRRQLFVGRKRVECSPEMRGSFEIKLSVHQAFMPELNVQLNQFASIDFRNGLFKGFRNIGLALQRTVPGKQYGKKLFQLLVNQVDVWNNISGFVRLLSDGHKCQSH
jgi:hypothetical protein